MLNELHIENIAVIEKADISFQKGLNVLTGETGAGKSIVIDSIGAVLGGRVSKELVRRGAEKGLVTAVFDAAGCEDWLSENDIEAEDELIIQRRISADGKSSCRVCGTPVTVSQLKELAQRLVDIHGQNDGRLLLDESRHREYLDRFGAHGDVIEDFSAATKRLNELKGQIRALGSVNVSAIEEYKEVSERYEFMSEQISDVERSRDELNKLIRELTDNMAQQFRDKFRLINTAFGETFSELFGGGRAELLLSDEHDILESDIEIKVQPPGKNLKSIEPLSGGEKGLAAFSLLFAILKVTPAPFCIFDEVEAALDDVNVSRYAQYVRRMTKNTQFILITHRRGTMEEADVLYGVTMQESGVSKLLELKTSEMAKQLGLA